MAPKIVSPEEASQTIRAGRDLGPIHVQGRLDLAKFDGESLPAGIRCYELDVRESRLRKLPPDLRIDGRLVLDGCAQLEELPESLSAGSISLRGCAAISALPEGLNTWFLDMTGCTGFERWPQRGTIHHGSLVLRGCARLGNLPSWLGRLSQLNLAECPALREIPEGVSVTGWIDIGSSGITSLPRSLAGAPLRWLGVLIDERIAFQPDRITAEETLAERNAERRRIMIERMGYLRFARESGAKVLDEDREMRAEAGVCCPSNSRTTSPCSGCSVSARPPPANISCAFRPP
ncbi:MAG: hypothetical protein H7067_00475 [Burkholderiales bacterium]|nr:hypothetical protein [Opitutaceae bacterium]